MNHLTFNTRNYHINYIAGTPEEQEELAISMTLFNRSFPFLSHSLPDKEAGLLVRKRATLEGTSVKGIEISPYSLDGEKEARISSFLTHQQGTPKHSQTNFDIPATTVQVENTYYQVRRDPILR